MDAPESLVVDACILFSFFKSFSARREVFKKLLDSGCTLICPDFALEELCNNRAKIIGFARITEPEFDEIFAELESSIVSFSEQSYQAFMSEAAKISPHNKDIPYFAISASANTPIWSDEDAFKNQSSVKVFTTKQLDKLLMKPLA